jgi:hypothetical protein
MKIMISEACKAAKNGVGKFVYTFPLLLISNFVNALVIDVTLLQSLRSD